MAQWNITTQDYLNQERSLFEVVGVASSDGRIISDTNRFPVSIGGTSVSIGNSVTVNQGTSPWVVTPSGGSSLISFPDSSVSAFEEPLAVTITPVLQSDAVYGLDPDFWNTSTINSGIVTVTSENVWRVGCTTDTNSYARLYTSRYLRYQPGQGAMFRWTAAFTSTGIGTNAVGINSIPQITGPIDREDGYAFGFSGDPANRKFGIEHRRNGKPEVRKLNITTAPTGTQTATITLNGQAFTVTLTSSTSTAYTSTQIAAQLKSNATVSNYWDIEACDGYVSFSYFTPGARTGTYSFSSTGTGTLAAGNFSTVQSGSNPSDTWTYIDNWDVIPTDFDPSKLNIFGVDYRWLGSGIVRFFIENPSTGKFVTVYTQKTASKNLYPHINKPTLRIAYRVGSTAGAASTQPVNIYGSSIFGGIQGIINQTGISNGYFNLDTTTRAKDTIWHLLSIQNPLTRSNQVNKSQLVIQNLTVSTKSTDPSVIYLVKNAVGTSDYLVFNPIPNVFAQYSVSSVTETLSSDVISNVQTLGINGSSEFNLIPYNLILAPGDFISVFMSSTSSFNGTTTGITWKVD